MYVYARDAYALNDTDSSARYLVSALRNGPQAVLEEVINEIRRFRPRDLGRIFLTEEFQTWMDHELETNNPIASLIQAACMDAGHHCEGSVQEAHELYTRASIDGGSLANLLRFHFVLKHRDSLFETLEASHEIIRTSIREISAGAADWSNFEMEYLGSLSAQISSGLYGDVSDLPRESMIGFRDLTVIAGVRLRP